MPATTKAAAADIVLDLRARELLAALSRGGLPEMRRALAEMLAQVAEETREDMEDA